MPPVGHTGPLLSTGEAPPWLRITDNSVSVYNHTGLDIYFLGLLWTLKFACPPGGPLSTRRAWMVGVQTLLTALLATLCLAKAEGLMTRLPDTLIVWPFIAMAFITAMNDIAIDGHYMEGISDPTQ
ncbi:MAG: hypothetical protein KAX46_14880 [Chromatiaceae bacterium]|nr:hypothetical protein [Chromatiaceae bacterium]